MTAGFLLESRKMGFIGTVIVWFIFVMCAVLIHPAPRTEPEYETVRITLAPLPAAPSLPAETSLPETPPAKTERPAAAETAASATSPAAVQSVSESAAARTEPAARPSSPATQSAATSSAASASAVQPARQELVKSVEELMAESAAARPKTTADAVNWDELFADGASVSEVSGGGTAAVNTAQTARIDPLSGRAAEAGRDQGAAVQNTADSRRREDSSVSEGTQNALERIVTASWYDPRSASGAVDYAVTADTASEAAAGSGTSAGNGSGAESGSGRIRIALTDGSLRTLLEPEKPVITISAANERYIDASREVSISFSIQPSGAVSPGSIRITPSSLLHQLVEDEIKAQIAKWRFQEAASSGQVSFKYNIIKR